MHVPGLLGAVLKKFQRCKSSTALVDKPEMMEEPFEEITSRRVTQERCRKVWMWNLPVHIVEGRQYEAPPREEAC